jgi:hydroxymethylpyrimidine pyrophosphatase-like HAD family hydrolase
VREIRLLAVDLDGTLLDPAGAISARTRRAVAAAHARGVTVALATARRFTGAAPVAAALEIPQTLILYDGAQMRAYPSGEVLFAQPLAAALGQRAAEVIAEHGLQPIAQHGDASGERLIVAPRPPRGQWADVYLEQARDQVEPSAVPDLCRGRPDPLRVVAFGPLRRIRQTARAVAAAVPVAESIRADGLVATQVLAVGNYGSAELTVFSPGASKGAALARLAELLEIPLAQTMAIGDGLNDLSMLRVVGLGVAMGTAPAALRRIATTTTASNLEDGAAQAIERYVLGWAASPTHGRGPSASPSAAPRSAT